MRSLAARALTAAALTVVSLFALSASANKKVIVESVDDYSACNGSSLVHSNSSALDFGYNLYYSTVGSGRPNYPVPQLYSDFNVVTTQFYDPERTGYSGDGDQFYFDQRFGAFSYYQGHGVVNQINADTSQYCTHDYNCTVLPSNCAVGATFPGFCARAPGNTFGHCDYTCKGKSLALKACAIEGASSSRVVERIRRACDSSQRSS